MKKKCTRCGRMVGHLNAYEGEWWVASFCDRCSIELDKIPFWLGMKEVNNSNSQLYNQLKEEKEM